MHLYGAQIKFGDILVGNARAVGSEARWWPNRSFDRAGFGVWIMKAFLILTLEWLLHSFYIWW